MKKVKSKDKQLHLDLAPNTGLALTPKEIRAALNRCPRCGRAFRKKRKVG